MNEWIARVMPLPMRDPFPAVDPLNVELARFRIRIIAPHDRPGLHAHGPRTATWDVGAVRILALDSANPFGESAARSTPTSARGWCGNSVLRATGT